MGLVLTAATCTAAESVKARTARAWALARCTVFSERTLAVAAVQARIARELVQALVEKHTAQFLVASLAHSLAPSIECMTPVAVEQVAPVVRAAVQVEAHVP